MWRYPLGLPPLFDGDTENLVEMVDLRPADHAIAGAAAHITKPQQAGGLRGLGYAIDQQAHRRAACLAGKAIELIGFQRHLRPCRAVLKKNAQGIPKDQEGPLRFHKGQARFRPTADRAYGYAKRNSRFLDRIGSCSLYGAGIWTPRHMKFARDRFAPASGLCRGRGFRGLPSLDIGQTPPRASWAELHRLGKGRVFIGPAPWGQVVDVVAFAKLAVREVSLGHPMYSKRLLWNASSHNPFGK